MPCDSQKDKMDDKKEAFKQAEEGEKSAERVALAADGAVLATCGAAMVAPIPAGRACAIALGAMYIAYEENWQAVAKKDRASNAYNTAKAAYDKCRSKLKPAKT